MRLAVLLALSLALGCAPFLKEDEKRQGNAMFLVDADGQLTTLLKHDDLPEWHVVYASGPFAGTTGDVFTENEVWRMPQGSRRARFSTEILRAPRGVPSDTTAALANLRIVPSSPAPGIRHLYDYIDVCKSRSQFPWGGWDEYELSGACSRENAGVFPGCLALCLPICGDGYTDVVGNEECEPSSRPNCRPDCTLIRCGDGILGPDEECDDGASNDPTRPGACHACKLPRCGDEIVDPGEVCDTGGPTDLCAANCTPSDCGDHTLQAEERCDDGNLIDADECTIQCQIPRGTPMLRVLSASVAFTPAFQAVNGSEGPEISLQGIDFRYLGRRVESLNLRGRVITFGAAIPPATSGTFRQPGSINLWAPDAESSDRSIATSTVVGIAPERVFILDVAEVSFSNRVKIELALHEGTDVIELQFGPSAIGWAYNGNGPAWQSYDGGRGEYLLCCGPFYGYDGWPANTRFTLEPYLSP